MKNTHVMIVTLLIGVYIALQLIADVSAAKIVEVGNYTMPAGTFVFALTFTWRDMLHKLLGKEWARAAIITAAITNLGMALYFWFAIELPAAVFWQNQDAFEGVLSVIPRIVIASILAELVSELTDTEIYHYLIARIPARHQWGRVLGSNLISLPLDSLIFGFVAFYGDLPISAIWAIIWGQIIFKTLVTIISLPLIYTIPENQIVPELVAANKTG